MPRSAGKSADVTSWLNRDHATHRDVAAIAVPIIFSNATVPLVGYVNTAVIGQHDNAAHLIGGVAVATVIFNNVFWIFGFLRMGTTGLTAQATGAGNQTEVAANLLRALVVSLIAGVTLIALQIPLGRFFLWAMGGSASVNAAAQVYFDIRIWSAPAALANFALVGWFIGLGRASIAFWLQLVLNGINIVLAVLFVFVLEFGVTGVGYAVLVAELVAVALGIVIARTEMTHRRAHATTDQFLNGEALRRMFAVNRDVIIRTACLIFGFTFFAAQGARAGDLTLAANTVLFGIALIFTYMIDGFAFAAEALVGQAVGARQRKRFEAAVRVSMFWAVLIALFFALLIAVAGGAMIDLATKDAAVRAAARDYMWWIVLVPIAAVWCFQLDGIFIGATETRALRNMAIVSVAVYLAAWATLQPIFANHGLWAALIVLFIARGISLALCYPALVRRRFPV